MNSSENLDSIFKNTDTWVDTRTLDSECKETNFSFLFLIFPLYFIFFPFLFFQRKKKKIKDHFMNTLFCEW